MLSALFLLHRFCVNSADVSAYEGGRFMTPAEALQVFGNEIHAQYYNGTDYVDCVFRYDSLKTITGIESEGTYQFTAGAQFLRYYCFQTGVVRNPQFITFDIKPTYSISNTSQIHTFIALGSDGYISGTYQSPSWDWSVGGSTIHLENNDRTVSGGDIRARLSGDDLYNASFVPFDWSSPSKSSGYSFRATFSGNQPLGYNNDRYVLALGLPYISFDATGSNGTLPPESSQPDINVSVSVDMSGVESRLDAVQSGLGNVAERVGDAVDGVNDIKDAINAAQGDSLASVEDVGVPPLPFDESTVDDVGEMLNDVPEEIAAGGFWWSLAFDVLHFSSPYWLIVPLICLLALMRHLLWRG